MRISSGMIYDAGITSMNSLTDSLLHTQQQVSSGRRILTPADDPVAAASVLDITQTSDINAQYALNQGNATSTLGLEGAQLSSASDLLTQAKQLAVQAGNATLNNSDRANIATELRAIFDQMLSTANSQDSSGQYLFSGNKGATQAFSGTVAGGVSYNGDSGQRKLQLSGSQQLAVSDSGNAVFQSIAAGNGYFATVNGASNSGSGLIDVGTVSDQAKWIASSKGPFKVSFAGVSSVTGTVNVSGAGVAITAGTNDKFSISVNGAAPKTVTITGASVSSASASVAALQTNIDAALGAGVAKVSINAANQLTVIASGPVGAAGVVIGAVAGNSGMASLFGAAPTTTSTSTNYDLVDANGNSLFTGTASSALGGTYTHAYVSGQPIQFSQSGAPAFDYGASVTITGAVAAGDTFSISPGKTQSVFTTLSNLILSLESGSTGTSAGSAKLTNDVNSALINIDQANNNLLSVQAAIGSRENEVTSLGNVNSSLNLQYQQTLSNLQDVNYIQAVSDLTRQQTQLQASQKSFAMVSQLSLFSYLP